jgi:hypothetical protein
VWRCRERRELLDYALTYHQTSNYERGKGLSGKQTRQKIIDIYSYLNSIYTLIYTGNIYIYIIYIYIYTYIHTYIYFFMSICIYSAV